jgi:putative ABC transport system permease protein
MTWQRTVTVLTLTIVMCAASGMLAMQKLRSADPAENF